MSDSILDTTKKALGITSEYTEFDIDIIMHINSVFATLYQIGVGPNQSFAISDKSTKWSDFIGDDAFINSVRSYMYLKVRLLFDPPATSFVIESMNKMAQEYEWRLSLYAPEAKYPSVLPESGKLWDLTGGADFPEDAPKGARGIDLNTGQIYEKR